MLVKEILEENVIYSDRFGKQDRPSFDNTGYDREVGEDILKSMKDFYVKKNALDKIPNELERKRFEKLLTNTNGNQVKDYTLVPYMRKFIRREDKTELTTLIKNIMLNKDHLYDSVKNINNLLRKGGTSNQVVGVSQNEEDWYFSE